MNKTWHERHKMPKAPTVEQRLHWHLAHSKHCGCRPVPNYVLVEMRKQGIRPYALRR